MMATANSMGTLPLTGSAGVGCAPRWISGLPAPLPNPPRKGEGAPSSFGHLLAKLTSPHLSLWGRDRRAAAGEGALGSAFGAR